MIRQTPGLNNPKKDSLPDPRFLASFHSYPSSRGISHLISAPKSGSSARSAPFNVAYTTWDSIRGSAARRRKSGAWYCTGWEVTNRTRSGRWIEPGLLGSNASSLLATESAIDRRRPARYFRTHRPRARLLAVFRGPAGRSRIMNANRSSSQTLDCVALLGRRDEPTDAVETYCEFLAGALAAHSIRVRAVRLHWPAYKASWTTGLCILPFCSTRRSHGHAADSRFAFCAFCVS